MIKIENVRTVGWEAAIRGARNPMNSWEKSDSWFSESGVDYRYNINGALEHVTGSAYGKNLEIGPNDLKLLSNLAKAGSDEAKFRRMIVVYVDITAPMYWWKEADTYKVGTVRNSCSTMHKIHAKEFTLEDFSTEHLISLDDLRDDGPGISCAKLVMYDTAEDWNFDEDTDCDDDTTIGTWAKQVLKIAIEALNHYRDLYLQTKDKKYWWQMIQLLPSSYNQRATLMLNYEVLANMYHARKNHKLDCWREFCKWIETLPYAQELIVDAGHEDTEKQLKDRIRYLETQLAKELYSKGLSIEDISNWMGMSETTIRNIVEENKS